LENYYSVIPLRKFRGTSKVSFYNVPVIDNLSAIDLVINKENAYSPGSINDILRPWYYHPHQEDNLFVTNGRRIVDLYRIGRGSIETFEVTPYFVKKVNLLEDGSTEDVKLLCDEPAILKWETLVFHRVITAEGGSASVNLAVHKEGFDIKTNFNVYDLSIASDTFTVLREGFKDQM
jgi:hypothetical protein